MSGELERLLELAKQIKPNEKQQESQRRSFAYGNTKFENERITRETIDRAAENLKLGKKD